jgi:predicted porin
MKKSLVALAALAVSGAAMAQVTIGGVVDQAYYSIDQKSRSGLLSTKQTGIGEGAWAGSRIRFSGTEDLGGGMKANFHLEQGIAPSDGNGFNARNGGNGPQLLNGTGQSLQNRQSWVGASGAFGEVRLGRVYAASYDMYTNSGHINGEYTGTTNASFPLFNRTKAINYISPTFAGGLKYYGTYGGRETEAESLESTQDQVGSYKTRLERAMSHRLTFNSGAFRAGISTEMLTQQFASNTAAVAGFDLTSVAVTTATNTNTIDSSNMVLLGGYNFGAMDLGVLIGTKTVNGSAANTNQVTTKLNQFNVKMPMGAAGEIRFTINKQTGDTAGVASSDISGTFLNYNYNLSKRTKLYASVGSQRDEVAADSVTATENRSAFGLVHTF